MRRFDDGCAEPEAGCEGASGNTRGRVCSPLIADYLATKKQSGIANGAAHSRRFLQRIQHRGQPGGEGGYKLVGVEIGMIPELAGESAIGQGGRMGLECSS